MSLLTSRAITRIGRAACLALVAVAATLYARQAGRSESVPVGLVIVTLDTTRADRISSYGYMDVSMPALDRLAAEGIVFDQATTVAPLTLPAHTSLFTGVLPPKHGVRDNADAPLADDHPTLAGILRARGFRTAAFVGSIVLDSDRGLARGFEQYQGVIPAGRAKSPRQQRRADEVIAGATRWLDTVGDSNFFLWAHLYDAHRPYDPPGRFRSIRNPYVGEIAFMDSQIGLLMNTLERRQLLDRTLVVVVGDHGESLGEHGERDHGIFTYESVLRVPLIVRAPNVRAGRVAEVVRLTDVMPTVLDLFNISPPATDGVSLSGLMRGTRHDLGLEAYAESMYPQRLGWSPVHALRRDRFKFIEAPRPELYDLERDPFEQVNVYERYPAVANAFKHRLLELERAGRSGWNEPSPAPPSLQHRLASLGYVARTGRRIERSGDERPDPKDCMGVYNSRLGTDREVPENPGRCR
jgi:arylsulfatase A-like enzyme